MLNKKTTFQRARGNINVKINNFEMLFSIIPLKFVINRISEININIKITSILVRTTNN